MKKTFAIFNKELKSFFYSPMAYVVIAIFTALTGVFFYLYLSNFVETAFRSQIMAQQYQQMPQKMNVNLMLIRPYFWNIALITLFTLPAITMRLFSEEKKQGTIELLYTSPISSMQIVLGKFMAGLAFFAVLLIPTILLGATFPLAALIISEKKKDSVGFVYSMDLVGAVIGSLVAGFILIIIIWIWKSGNITCDFRIHWFIVFRQCFYFHGIIYFNHN